MKPLNSQIEYVVFDIIEPENLPYEDRYALLVKAWYAFLAGRQQGAEPIRWFRILPSEVVNSDEEIMAKARYFISQRYEGIMIRKLAGPPDKRTDKTIKESQYRSGRVSNLLKWKDFIDEEGTVVGYFEEKSDRKGLIMFKMKSPTGQLFDLRPVGGEELRQKWFATPSKILGKKYTYRFQEYTDDGKPRFPTGVGFREDLEGEEPEKEN
jgi:ATP-dependent DNA ligase